MWNSDYITSAERQRRKKVAEEQQLKDEQLRQRNLDYKQAKNRARSNLHKARCERYFEIMKKERVQTKSELIESAEVSLATFNKDQPIFLEMYEKNLKDPTQPYVVYEKRPKHSKNKKKFYYNIIEVNARSLFSDENPEPEKLDISDNSDKYDEMMQIVHENEGDFPQ